MSKFFDDFLYKSRLISPEEYHLRSLPEESRNIIKDSLLKCQDLSVYSDIESAVKHKNIIEKELNNISMKYSTLASTGIISGYESAGSALKKLYPNPFAPYAFIGDNYWAAFKARREARIEILRDGYVLTAPERFPQKKIKEINDFLESLNIAQFRADAADHLNVFGNCWIDPKLNKFGALKELSLLLPEKIVPVLDDDHERIVGWDYIYGNRPLRLSLKDVDHLKTTSLRTRDLGTPALGPIIVDVEADMFASIYNSTVFRKGGLVKAIVSMDNMNSSEGINDGSYLALIAELQKWFEKQFGGVRGSGQVVFTPNVKGVHNLVNPKDLEGAHANTTDRTAVRVCELLGVPPERLGLSRSSQYQNNNLIDDSVSLSFDNNNYFIVGIVDKYINEKIIKGILKEDQVTLKMAGEYGSISKSAAEFGKLISECGADIMTVNEFRRKVLHFEESSESNGEQYLGQVDREIEEKKSSKPASPASKRKIEILPNGTKIIKHFPREIKYY